VRNQVGIMLEQWSMLSELQKLSCL